MIVNLLKRIFGSQSTRAVQRLLPVVRKINALEESYQQLTEEQLTTQVLQKYRLLF